MQDSREVIELVEKLRQAILIYQVSVRHHQSWKSLTRGAGITTTIDIQSSRPFDREFQPLILNFKYKAKPAAGRFKSSFDALLKLHQVIEYVCGRGCSLTHLQASPIKNKIESVRARLDRLGVEGDAAKNPDEVERRKSLYECVFSIRRDQPPVLSWSQSPRGDQGEIAASI